jgi:uncharacterized protein YjbJ (UPF0337 family)
VVDNCHFWVRSGELAARLARGCSAMSAVDKAKDKAQVAKGKVKSAAGRASGDRSLETKGKADQVSGNVKQAGEKLKDAAKP